MDGWAGRVVTAGAVVAAVGVIAAAVWRTTRGVAQLVGAVLALARVPEQVVGLAERLAGIAEDHGRRLAALEERVTAQDRSTS